MNDNDYSHLDGFAIDHRIRELNPISITFKNPAKNETYILNIDQNHKYFKVLANNEIIEFDYLADALNYIKNEMLRKL